MSQDIQPPPQPLEEMSRALGIQSLFQAVVHFRDPSRRRRLLHRLLGILVVAAALNYYVLSAPTSPLASGWTSLLQLLGAAAIACVTTQLLARRVHGNVYREIPMRTAHRLAMATVMTVVGIFAYSNTVLRHWVLTSSVVMTMVPVSFLLHSLLTLTWLMRYEKKNGPVYIVEETPRASA